MELWQVIFLVVYFVCFGFAAYSGVANSKLQSEIEKMHEEYNNKEIKI